MAGPLVGVLGQTFGVRAVTFWGGIVAAVGSALCTLAPNIQWIGMFWGGIHGLGFALANTLFQVIINQYFHRHRASASGIVLSGACLSSLILPLAIESALVEYGLSGCFLLLAGLFLNVLPPSLVLKSPPWVEFPEAYARQYARHCNLLKNQGVLDPSPFEDAKWAESEPTNKTEDKESCPQRPDPILGKFPKAKHSSSHEKQAVVCILYNSLECSELPFSHKNGSKNGINNPASAQKSPLSLPPEKRVKGKLMQNLRGMPLLYLNPVFVLISVSLSTYFLLFLPVITVIVDYPRDKGLPQGQEKFLIYTLTFGDLFGRLAFGWVTDRKYVSLPFFMLLSFVFQGVFVALMPLATKLVVWIAIVGLYGVAAGVIFVHFPVLVHWYVDQNNQSIAIGCVGLMSSAVTFGIPPLIGYFRDHIGSYDGLFYIIAVCSVINGMLWLLVPTYEMYKEQKNVQEDLKVIN